MQNQTVLMGCFLSVHVHLGISDLSSEIIALCCPPCVCIDIYLDIYISKECKNITLAKLLFSLLSKCVFVTAETCIYVWLVSMVLMCSMWNALSDCILSSRAELKQKKILCVIFTSLQFWALSTLRLLYKNRRQFRNSTAPLQEHITDNLWMVR